MLLHVFGEIGFLCVRLTTVLANMSLEMLGLFMLRNVRQEGRLIRKTLVAGVAFKRFVCLVTPGMALQVAELRERLVTAWMPTLVRLVPCMRANVLL